MSLQDLINCAPFRLAQPRPLTTLEWNFIGDAMATVTFTKDVPMALIPALQSQPCENWRTSSFGPAPAVSPRWYMALARWFSQLNPQSKQNAIAGIKSGLLCSSQGPAPWAAFDPANVVTNIIPGGIQVPILGSLSSQQVTNFLLWEGCITFPGEAVAAQVQSGNVDACGRQRVRTHYIPVTGQNLMDLVNGLNAKGGVSVPGFPAIPANMLPGLPPFLAPFLTSVPVPQQLLQQTFLVGFEFSETALSGKPPPGASPIALLNVVFSNIALIWAPGQGADIRGLFRPDGTVDAAQLAVLLQAMLPGMAGTILPGILGQALPANLPNAAQSLPGLLSAAAAAAAAMAGGASPQTPRDTGVPILDTVPSVKPASANTGSTAMWVGAALAVGIAALVLAWSQSED